MSLNQAYLNAQFTGTEDYFYHTLFKQFVYTEGVKYIASEAECYWLLEKIFANQNEKEIKQESFQVWQLTKDGKNKAILEMNNGNNELIHSEKIEYTDFPFDKMNSLTLWFTNKTLLLPSEY